MGCPWGAWRVPLAVCAHQGWLGGAVPQDGVLYGHGTVGRAPHQEGHLSKGTAAGAPKAHTERKGEGGRARFTVSRERI